MQQLRNLVQSRSTSDWRLIVGVGVVLLAILLFVTSITPYEPDTQQLYYESNPSQSSVTYLRAELTEEPGEDGAKARLLDGAQKGRTVTILGVHSDGRFASRVGETIIVSEGTTIEQSGSLFYVDKLRIPGVILLTTFFVALVALIGGRRGVLSIAGLFLSLLIIGWFIVPLVVDGYSPFWTILAGSYIIATVSILVSHGMRRRTYISIGCICLVLTIIAGLIALVSWLFAFSGVTDEATMMLVTNIEELDTRGIVAGGMIIATLGVLDDVITTQVATVEELHKANSRQSKKKLFLSASSVGTEHIASIVNTLALAYAGASLPLIIFLMQQSSSTFMVLNGEYITLEIVRTLVASVGLIIAVPISTLIASILYKRFDTIKS